MDIMSEIGKIQINFTPLITNYYSTEETNEKMKIKSTEWEKLFANHISDEELVFRLYKGLQKIQTTWFKNGQRTWIDIPPKRIRPVSSKHIKDAQYLTH